MTTEAPPRPATATERKVAEMLLENTGSNMMDSGGWGGRAWQHTRAKYGLESGLPNSAWDGSPKATHDPKGDEIERVALAMHEQPEGWVDSFGTVYVDTFHWLVNRIDYDPALMAKYERWQRVTNFGKDRYDKDWGLPLIERFLELLGNKADVAGLYGDGNPVGINTYNGECELDRTLQFTMFTVEGSTFLPDGSYVLLQIHGGADVRGGYTDPVLFSCSDEDMFDFDRVEVWCEGAATDIVPDGQIEGQVTMDAEILTPVHVEHSHRWDNSYGDSHLRLTYADGQYLDDYGSSLVQVLALPYREDEAQAFIEDGVQLEYEYKNPEGVIVRPAKYAHANVATKDDNDVWRCPFDGSPLVVSGNMVG